MTESRLFLRQRACLLHLLPGAVVGGIAMSLGGFPLDDGGAAERQVAMVVMFVLAGLAYCVPLLANLFPLSRTGSFGMGRAGGSSFWTDHRPLVTRGVFFGRALIIGGFEALCVLSVLVNSGIEIEEAAMPSIVFPMTPVIALLHTAAAWRSCADGLRRGTEQEAIEEAV